VTMFTSTGFSFLGLSQRSTRVDSEPHFGEELKAIRDKKERFLSGKMGRRWSNQSWNPRQV
jgi:hypothetical protein